jgi:hypothetical protein
MTIDDVARPLRKPRRQRSNDLGAILDPVDEHRRRIAVAGDEAEGQASIHEELEAWKAAAVHGERFRDRRPVARQPLRAQFVAVRTIEKDQDVARERNADRSDVMLAAVDLDFAGLGNAVLVEPLVGADPSFVAGEERLHRRGAA